MKDCYYCRKGNHIDCVAGEPGRSCVCHWCYIHGAQQLDGTRVEWYWVNPDGSRVRGFPGAGARQITDDAEAAARRAQRGGESCTNNSFVSSDLRS